MQMKDRRTGFGGGDGLSGNVIGRIGQGVRHGWCVDRASDGAGYDGLFLRLCNFSLSQPIYFQPGGSAETVPAPSVRE